MTVADVLMQQHPLSTGMAGDILCLQVLKTVLVIIQIHLDALFVVIILLGNIDSRGHI